MSPELYLLLADSLLVLHVLLVAFVIFGLVAVFLGRLLHWRWVRNFWFRVTHLVVIGIVVLQAWLGVLCPLTVWEMELRERAGAAGNDPQRVWITPFSSEMTISTRRFCCRPALVSLDATG
ncbi:DUF2784 domain-containing protein [Marinobacter pelagius]|uniref:DUF2784 domain-containing protein n=1 Tax=Marinobacter sp. C7 TaxID=2951363 RepID=UPI001EEFEE02|nr:DUF2784 domain-containing protein [Marinobacter sp. C7]MCG7200196.1 DUF2784 domain-containing protein [Marinobacter sp. C7]